MKYTIPYEDKITLPHVKKIETIGINTQKISYDSRELTGEVIVNGDYLLDNSEDVMEFTHDIPISFLIDDDKVSPEINISNFKYELIPGRGLTVMFELDVIFDNEEEEEEEIPRDEQEYVEEKKEADDEAIPRDEVNDEDEEIKDFQNQIDENLDLVLNNRKVNETESEVQKDEDDRPLFKSKKEKKQTIEEEKKETPTKQLKEEGQKVTPKTIQEEEKETPLQQIQEEEEIVPQKEIEEEKEETPTKQLKEEGQKITPKTIKEEKKETPLTQALEEAYGEELATNMKPTPTTFDTGFIPRDNDKYTTYKILLIEENDNIDDLLEERNLSKALLCKEYQFNNKVVLKLEND